jgi:hypothetical protein
MNRQNIISKAMTLYGGETGNNIAEALALYLQNNATAEEQIPLTITNAPEMTALVVELSFSRPICEDCGGELGLLRNVRGIDGTIYTTAWTCRCGRIEYSEKSVEEWTEILRENRE